MIVFAGMTGTLTFIIIPCASVPTGSMVSPSVTPGSQSLHVKAYFDYDPDEDLYIPCR